MKTEKIDIEYIERLRKGDSEAIDYIYKYYRNPLYYFALTLLKNEADAEEAVQETFIKVIEKIHTLKDNKAFHSWIFTIIFNHSTNVNNRKRKDKYSDGDSKLEEFVESKEISDDMDEKELVSVVKTEIMNLPTMLHEVAFLKYFDDLTVNEISEILSIPTGTIKSRLVRIRKLLQPKLEEKGYTPTKYLSVGFTPIVYQAFQELVVQNQMSAEASVRVLDKITTIVITTGSVKGGVFLGGTTKILITTAVVTGVGFTGYQSWQSQASGSIEKISYYNELSSSSIEVEALMNGDYSENQIQITRDAAAVDYVLEGKQLIFVADTNGTYRIAVEDEETAVEITNIDKELPKLNGVAYENNTLQFNLSDNKGIDYQTSYILYEGEKHMLPENQKLEIDINGSFQLFLSDVVGNLVSYEIDVNEE